MIKGGKKLTPFIIDSSHNMKGLAFMTSSSSDEVSQESEKIKGSFFTHYLIAGLRGAADVSKDGRITLNEAYQFAYSKTLAGTEKTISGPQHPNSYLQMSGTGDVVMTDIRKSSSLLVIKKSVHGMLYIRNSEKILIAEFYKPFGDIVELGLERGQYSIINERDQKLFEAGIRLGKKTELSVDDFSIVDKEATTARGLDTRTASDGRKRVAVLEFSEQNVPRTYADIARDVFEINLHKSNTYTILERSQINIILKEQGLQMTGCADTDCAVEIGKALTADYVVIGSIYKITTYTVSAKMVDISKGNIIPL